MGTMTEDEELAHLHAPSADPKQRMIDYWGRRAEKAEATKMMNCGAPFASLFPFETNFSVTVRLAQAVHHGRLKSLVSPLYADTNRRIHSRFSYLPEIGTIQHSSLIKNRLA